MFLFLFLFFLVFFLPPGPSRATAGTREIIIARPMSQPHSVCAEIEMPKASRRQETCGKVTIRLGVRSPGRNGFYAYLRSERRHLAGTFFSVFLSDGAPQTSGSEKIPFPPSRRVCPPHRLLLPWLAIIEAKYNLVLIPV